TPPLAAGGRCSAIHQTYSGLAMPSGSTTAINGDDKRSLSTLRTIGERDIGEHSYERRVACVTHRAGHVVGHPMVAYICRCHWIYSTWPWAFITAHADPIFITAL